MNNDFNFKSVLNTDSYDKRRYTEIRELSQRLRDKEKEGTKSLPTFPHLMGDVWSGLFKTNPQIAEKPNKEVSHHKPIVEKLMQNNEYQSMREYTKLDEFVSAISTLKLSDAAIDIINNLDEETKKQMNEAENNFNQAEQKRQEAEMRQQGAKMTQNPEQQNQLLEQAKKLLQQAKSAENKGQKASQQAGQQIQQFLETAKGQQLINGVIIKAKSQAKEETEQVNSLVKGINAGNQPGEHTTVSPYERIKLAEAIANNEKLKKIAKLTGKAKQIAEAKQKTKSENTPQRSSIEYGDAAERMLPQELLVLKNQRQEFLRRYAESNILQYSKEGKESLGKGPIIVLIDSSGSMYGEKDEEAKAVSLALLSIAAKQNRAYSMINFSSRGDIKDWLFHNAKKIKANDIIEMAQFFFNNGTDFMSPLDKAKKIIKSDKKFKKADIVLITDGYSNITDNWLENYLKFKKEYKVNIISVQIGDIYKDILEKFSDKVINSSSLFSDDASAIFEI